MHTFRKALCLLLILGFAASQAAASHGGEVGNGHCEKHHKPKRHAVLTYKEVTFTCWDHETGHDTVPGMHCGCRPPSDEEICVAKQRITHQRKALVPVIKWVVEHECEECRECSAQCHETECHDTPCHQSAPCYEASPWQPLRRALQGGGTYR